MKSVLKRKFCKKRSFWAVYARGMSFVDFFRNCKKRASRCVDYIKDNTFRGCVEVQKGQSKV